MKKILTGFGTILILASCGGTTTAEKATTDSTNVNMANQSPMGDTANQINNRAGNYPMNTSNQNGDDSVKGTNPASRSTTPGGGGAQRTGHGNE